VLKEARERAGLSQEKASRKLFIGRRTLHDYEKKDDAPRETILKMSEVYGDQGLPLRYCWEKCPIGRKYATPVVTTDLAQMVLKLVKELNDVKAMRDRLIAIAADGVIDEREVAEFMTILQELKELEAQINALKLWALRFEKRIAKEVVA